MLRRTVPRKGDAALKRGGFDRLVHVLWAYSRHLSLRGLLSDLIEDYAGSPATPTLLRESVDELAGGAHRFDGTQAGDDHAKEGDRPREFSAGTKAWL
jgi:hypothetical protein